ncbi:hypothetical protein HJFPF1_05500 [Paramyrothecium foliicola]|nr:hypothetical protein HJFPF1_05500 [Paramyrothecium foliicola]
MGPLWSSSQRLMQVTAERIRVPALVGGLPALSAKQKSRARQPRARRTQVPVATIHNEQTAASIETTEGIDVVDTLQPARPPGAADSPPPQTFSDNSESLSQDVTLDATTTPGSDQSNQSSKSGDGSQCSCIDDLLDIVQKLDDDEFNVRSLTFDQVLKLQKYLLFQCLQPMSCRNCSHIPRVHTLILVICDRVTWMFQCLSRRLSNIQPAPILAASSHEAQASAEGSPASFFSFKTMPTDSSDWNTSQIFDRDSGRPSIAVVCNAELFSDSFRDQYSAEEQFLMIQALARIQIRNFKQLLNRVHEMPQSQRSQARLGRIQALNDRLAGSATVMEESFQSVIQDMGGS